MKRGVDLLRHLLYFSVVAEQRHVGRAAAELTMSQPPLSQAIGRLERHLGVSLFDRGPRGMRLTDAGRALLPRARALLDDEAALRRAAARLGDTARRVRIGVVQTIGARAASDLCVAAAGVAGGTPVELLVGSVRELVDGLRSGELGLGVVTHPAVLDTLDAGPVVERPLHLLLPSGHPAARAGGPVRVDQLHGLAPVLEPRAHGTVPHDVMLDVLDLHGCTRAPLEADSPATGLAAVATGQGFMLSCDPDLAASGVARRPIGGDPIPARVRLVWRRPGPPRALLDAVQRCLEGTAREAPDARPARDREAADARPA